MGSPLRLLVVDEDIRWRDTVREALAAPADMVCSTSSSSKAALLQLRQQAADVVVLAASLKDPGAVELTQAIMAEWPEAGIIITAANSPLEADTALAALGVGAFDVMLKPDGQGQDRVPDALQRVLVPKVRAFSIRRYSRRARALHPSNHDEALPVAPLPVRLPRRAPATHTVEAVLLGVSTGGPDAMGSLLPALPADFPVPVIIVLHMPHLFTRRLAEALNRGCALRVSEAEDGQLLAPGGAYFAPGGLHLSLVRGPRRQILAALLDTPPENGCKPSVDVLFRSAAESLRPPFLAVVLTGMGEDGTRGVRTLKERGATVIVQDEGSSVVWGMPGSVVRAGCADEVLPLSRMAARIIDLATAK